MGATLADPVQFLVRPDREAVIMSALAPGRSWTANMQRTWSLCRHLHQEGYQFELIRDCQRRFESFSGRMVIVDFPAGVYSSLRVKTSHGVLTARVQIDGGVVGGWG
jgi:hypothetical protein